MTSYKLFSHSEPLRAILWEIEGLFNRITPFDIKHVKYLAEIFQDLEHLYDFQTISYGGHFVFQNEAKIFQRPVFIAINIPCKFGEDIFISE